MTTPRDFRREHGDSGGGNGLPIPGDLLPFYARMLDGTRAAGDLDELDRVTHEGLSDLHRLAAQPGCPAYVASNAARIVETVGADYRARLHDLNVTGLEAFHAWRSVQAAAENEVRAELNLPAAEDPLAPSTPSSLVDWTALFQREREDTDWLIEPIVGRGRSHVFYGPAKKARKSLTMMGVIAPAAVGRPVLDFPGGRSIRTLVLDYEQGDDDVEDRLADMGFTVADATALEALAYHLFPACAPLDTEEGGLTVLRWALEHRAEHVVIDTVSRAVKGPENEADTIRALYRCTIAPLKAHGIAVSRLDHSGKDELKGQRGSSSKVDDVDLVWKMSSTDTRVKLEATHARMNWAPREVTLNILQDPLRFEIAADSWLPGVADCAAAMDQLGLDAEVSQRPAVAAIKDADLTFSRDVIRQALRYRRGSDYAIRQLTEEGQG